MVKEKKPVIGISMGDMNGIGPEVIIKALSDKRINDFCTPVIYGSESVLEFYKKTLKLPDFKLNIISSPTEAKRNYPNLIKCISVKGDPTPGIPTKEAGKLAFECLDKAIKDLQSNELNALVTAPIDKSTIQSEDFKFPGHTEYLAEKDGNESLMILVAENLRVAVVTGHIPLKDVASSLTSELIMRKIELLNKSLINDFGVHRPKIAVLGLNPHAGENGLLGTEEEKIISPAIRQVKTKEIFAFGPFPADGFFGSANFNHFDGILAMYHDQGLIPIKTLCFDESVNYTSGLSFIRTSPDHGTAYNIAGKNMASPQSLRNSIYAACDIVKKRMNQPVEVKITPKNNIEIPEESDIL